MQRVFRQDQAIGHVQQGMNGFRDTAIIFTMDQDWVDDDVLGWAVRFFLDRDVPVTVFATGASSVLQHPPSGVEVGIHPNFFGRLDHESCLREIRELYPDARGVRAHGLFEYSNLLSMYARYGLVWDSTPLHYACEGIRPYRHPSGIVRIPIFWEDDDYLDLYPDWSPDEVLGAAPGLKVFDIHPIHLRLNSVTLEAYRKYRNDGATPEALAALTAQDTVLGIRVLCEQILAMVKTRGYQVTTMGEACQWV